MFELVFCFVQESARWPVAVLCSLERKIYFREIT